MSAFVMARSDAAVLRWLLAAAAVAVVIHGQIEMTFHYGGAVVWAMCVLGVAAADETCNRRPHRIIDVRSSLLVLTVAVWIGAFGAVPVGANEKSLKSDARALAAIGENPSAACAVRRKVAEGLTLNSEHLGRKDYRLPLAAVQQYKLAAAACDTSERVELHKQAVGTLERAMVRFNRQSIIVAAVEAHAQLAALTNDQAHWSRAVELATEITRCDPHGIASWRNLGDISWAAGRQNDAAKAYERALQNNTNFELDEFKQLSDRDRTVLQGRLNHVRASSGRAAPP
jgi:tetratricopeptide (TPR) repeat protein